MIPRACILCILLLLPQPLLAMSGKSIVYHGSAPNSVSLPAVLAACLLKPDFIELPIMLSRDNHPVVFNNLVLQRSTNVARLFADRRRQDGNFYVIDFSLEELQQLSYLPSDGRLGDITTHPVSLSDMLSAIDFISSQQELAVQAMPVIKYPWFFKNEGKDISSVVLKALIAHAGSADDPLFLKCFDPDELQRISKDVLPGLPVEVHLVQGIETSAGRETMRRQRDGWTGYNYQWFFTRLGLRVAASYAEILALASPEIVPVDTLQQFINDSQGLKMKVFITVEAPSQDDYEELLFRLNADGLALENPLPLRRFLEDRQLREGTGTGDINGGDGAVLTDPQALIERLKKVQEMQ